MLRKKFSRLCINWNKDCLKYIFTQKNLLCIDCTDALIKAIAILVNFNVKTINILQTAAKGIGNEVFSDEDI
jgi:hypothetical protein